LKRSPARSLSTCFLHSTSTKTLDTLNTASTPSSITHLQRATFLLFLAETDVVVPSLGRARLARNGAETVLSGLWA
jgi:hypothetical protein